MSELFPLNQKDVEAVAKSRVNRAEGNKPTFYVVLAMAFIIAGIFVSMNFVGKEWIGWIVALVGAVFFVVYMQKLGKKQNAYKRLLLQEWHEEQLKNKE